MKFTCPANFKALNPRARYRTMIRMLCSLRMPLAISVLAMPALLQGQSTGHYAPGLEGIKGASLPPPGWYVRDYNLFYSSSQFNDAAGNRVGAANLDVLTYANAPRLIWITDTKLLGGFLGM